MTRSDSQVFDLDRFALMFGSASTKRRPDLYHLMALSMHGGIDLMIPWSSMLIAAPKILHHEEGFCWAAMSPNPNHIHCALLECLLRECNTQSHILHINWNSAKIASWGSNDLDQQAHSPSLLTAYQVMNTSSISDSTASLEAIAEHVAQIAPSTQTSFIPSRISSILAQTLLSGTSNQSAQIIASANEAITLNHQVALTKTISRGPRI